MTNETERILVCCGGRCADNGARDIAHAIEEEIARRGFQDPSSVKVVRVGCAGECDQGPIVRLMPRDVTYYRVSAKHVTAIVDSIYGEPLKKLLFRKKRQHFEKLSDNPFFGLQHRVTLRFVGVVDPLSISDYIACGGYTTLKNAQTSPRLDFLEKLQKSGLRIKCSAPPSPKLTWLEMGQRTPRQIVCNVNRGVFGNPMGILLAEGSPHVLVEGMALAMHASGANEGFFHMSQEDAPTRDVLQRAIKDASDAGILGLDLGEIKCSLDLPEPANDNATVSATLSLDAETLAAIPIMLDENRELHGSTNRAEAKETKAFALNGKAKHVGFVEAPMGTSLRTVIFKIDGGVAGDRPLKALEIGKPAGLYLPETLIDLPIDFDSFAQHNIPMDAGTISVLDDRSCIVKTMRDDLRQLCTQNQVTDCSENEDLRRAIAILERLCAGDGEPNDIEALNRIGLTMREASTSHFEQRVAHSLLSSIEHFRSEYEAHALEKRCPAGSCPKLTQFVISPESCAGCDVCSNACPEGAIIGEQRQPHIIDYEKCISCGTCRDLCRFHAILAERRSLVPKAIDYHE